MAAIPQLTSLGSHFFININFNTHKPTNASPTQFAAEHIWISSFKSEPIHGFKFSNLTKQQQAELNQFIDFLKQ
jgi:hypothetical protein